MMRLGIIGAGDIAGLQLKYFSRRDDVQLVALADVNVPRMESLRHSYPQVACYADYRKMLKQERLDAVSVCTPNRLHATPTIAALKAGAHVLCEKPLAMTVAEGLRMARAAQSANRKLVVGFQYRLDPRTQYLKQAADGGAFGNILYGRVKALRRRGIPNWGVFGQKALSGGGPLIDIGVHALEMCHYTMGSPQPVSASADMFTYLGNQPSDTASMWPDWDHSTYDVEDLVVGRVRFDDGSVLSLECSYAAHIGRNSEMNFQLMGTAGGGTWEPPAIHKDEHGHMIDSQPAWLASHDFQHVFGTKIDAFVEHILYDAPCAAPVEHGLMVQSMLNALYRSAHSDGREVRIKPLAI